MIEYGHVIPTTYCDVQFRSRLEARWAYVFDMLRIGWKYEPQSYFLSSGPYLPDFLLDCRNGGLFFEVKPTDPGWGYKARLGELAELTQIPVILLDVSPVSNSGFEIFYGSNGWDEHYQLCVCPDCLKADFQFDGRYPRIGCGCQHFDPKYPNTQDPDLENPNHKRIVQGIADAQKYFKQEMHNECLGGSR
jgi:hypothetical protein